MAMSKKDFIALADAIRDANANPFTHLGFSEDAIQTLSVFCAKQNPAFMRHRWISYINGECGPNGGAR